MTESVALTAESRRALAFAVSVVMSEISERCYCAGWMAGLSDGLWDLVARQDLSGHGYWLEPDELTALTELSSLMDGWIGQDERLVRLSEWEATHACHPRSNR